MQIEIEAVNDRLAAIYAENPEGAFEMMHDVVEYLDEMWNYIGDVFMITGKWHFPNQVMISDEGILCKLEYVDAFNIAKSNGFTISHIIHEG